MLGASNSNGRSRAIERFVMGAVGVVVAITAVGAALGAGVGLSAAAARREANRANAAENAAIVELAALQKQVQIDVIQVQQWLTDISATRGQDGLNDGFDKAAESARDFKRDSDRALALAEQLKATEVKGALVASAAGFDAYYETGRRMARAYVDQGPSAGNLLMGEFDATASRMTEAVDETAKAASALVAARRDANARLEADLLGRQQLAMGISGLAAILSAAGGLVLVLVLRKRLLRPLGELGGYMTRLADGDYEAEVPFADSRTELGDMAKSIAVFREAAVFRKDARLAREAEQQAEAEARVEREAARRAEEARRETVLRALADGLERLSSGDVAHRVDIEFSAEYAALKSDFNGAAERLEAAMRRIAGATGGVGASAEEVSRAADDLSRRTEHQAASLEETAAALDQITATVRETAGRAAEARDRIAQTRAEARQTDTVVGDAVGAVSEIEASSRQISQIIGVIDEIAFQTNLLALNAGVEAARAGDAGRGFAVVASEVRALAQRSAEAAKEIKSLIAASSGKVAEGVQLVGRAGDALRRIMGHVEGLSDIAQAISGAAQEQAVGLSEVNTAVNEMDRITQQNAAMVEQMSAAAQTLKHQSQGLDREVAAFRLGEATDAQTRVWTRAA